MSDPWVILSSRFAPPILPADDDDLAIPVQRYRPDPAEFERAWSEAVSQMSAEQLIDVAKFMTTAAEPTEEPSDG